MRLPHDLRIFVPVDLRPRDEPVPATLGNRFGIVFVKLPVSVADPLARVRAVHERMARVKGGAQAASTFAILAVVGCLAVLGAPARRTHPRARSRRPSSPTSRDRPGLSTWPARGSCG